MEQLKASIRQLVAEAGKDLPFEALMERFCRTLQAHPEALGALSGRYRLRTEDTGAEMAFALGENSFRLHESGEEADATISGKEADLVALLRHELTPAAAMLTGRLKVKGSMKLLRKFAQVL